MNIDQQVEQLRRLKNEAGSHSPSRTDMVATFGYDPVRIDACFLSNPYATELVRGRFTTALSQVSMAQLIEAYPPGQRLILEWMSKIEGIDPSLSVACNGAVQAIEWLMGDLDYDSVLICYPTFSTYYEAIPRGRRVVRHDLRQEDGFKIDLETIISKCRKEKVELVVLINPNNPTGGGVSSAFVEELAIALPETKIIVDESFIHFSRSYLDWRTWRRNVVRRFPSLFFIKSLSKDFGVAGFRLGYLEGSGPEVQALRSRCGTWNINNFAVICLQEMARSDFLEKYEAARHLFLREMSRFVSLLGRVKQVRVYSTDANFALVQLLNSTDGFSVVAKMLTRHGVYVRTMGDKIGLDHRFIRIACRTKDENDEIVSALSACAD